MSQYGCLFQEWIFRPCHEDTHDLIYDRYLGHVLSKILSAFVFNSGDGDRPPISRILLVLHGVEYILLVCY